MNALIATNARFMFILDQRRERCFLNRSPLATARGTDYCGLNPVARRKASTYLPSFFVARPFRYSTSFSKSFGSQSGRYLLIEGSNWLTCLLTALIFRSTTSVISTQ